MEDGLLTHNHLPHNTPQNIMKDDRAEERGIWKGRNEKVTTHSETSPQLMRPDVLRGSQIVSFKSLSES